MNNLTQIYNNNFHEKGENLYLYVKIGNEDLAIKVSQVLEIMKLPKVLYVQKMPNNIVGVLPYNNLEINVLDVRFYLDREVRPYDISTQLVIAKTDESIMGIIADKVEDIIFVEDENIIVEDSTNELNIVNMYIKEGEKHIPIINLFNLEKILLTKNEYSDFNVISLYPKDEVTVNKMEERARALVAKSSANIVADVFSFDKYVAFKLGKGRYFMDLTFVKEILKNPKITPIPCSPDHIVGLTSLRGDFLAVVDLQAILDRGITELYREKKVIVIQSETYRMGFLVDEIFSIIELPKDKINAVEFDMPKYIMSEMKYEDDIFGVLDMKKLLADDRLFVDEK